MTEVVLTRSADTEAQIERLRLAGFGARSGAEQGLWGYLDQLLTLHQREQVAGCSQGNGIGEKQVLQHQDIKSSEGRAADCLCWLPPEARVEARTDTFALRVRIFI